MIYSIWDTYHGGERKEVEHLFVNEHEKRGIPFNLMGLNGIPRFHVH